MAKKGTGAHDLRLWRRHLDPWEQLASLFVFFFLADRQTDMQRLIVQSESKIEVGTVEKHHRYTHTHTHDVMDWDGGGEN